MRNYTILLVFFLGSLQIFAQDSTSTFKKRVLEGTEIDFLGSYYSQDGNNAAVTGGLGTEKLTDAAPTVVVSIPINDDDVLTIDAGISAYTSASSSNIDPFDTNYADPFTASSGASSSDTWANVTGSYSHSNDDRNRIVSGKVSFSNEYDYTSIGFGGSYTWLFNEKIPSSRSTEMCTSIPGRSFILTSCGPTLKTEPSLTRMRPLWAMPRLFES